MCGLAGLLYASGVDAEQSLAAMLQAQKHRGPDATGRLRLLLPPCVLGHNRLAVIDTSDAATQPMSRDGVHLVYNGELYNFQEERRRLEAEGVIFRSRSDAEVLLLLYLKHGRDCPRYIRGMYAFAIWDEREQALFCARDPLGIKPFLYYATPHEFVFASELKGLLASGLVPREADRAMLRALIQRGSIPQPYNIVQGVRWLLPGHSLTVKPGGRPEIRAFYEWEAAKTDFTGAEYPELLRVGKDLLKRILKRQIVSDVPVGAFLSGGIDSSLIAALLAEEISHLRTYSVGFDDGLTTETYDETADAAEVATHLGIRHEKIVVGTRDIADRIADIARGLDHPTVDGVNSWFVSQAVRRHVTVAISGTGGDELFAGYPWFAAMYDFCAAPLRERLGRLWQGPSFMDEFTRQYHIFDAQSAQALCPGAPEPPARPDPLKGSSTLNRVTGLLLSGYTRDQLLADMDAASMWHGLEVRVPLLDEELLAFALSLPDKTKLGPSAPRAAPGSYAASGVKRLLLDIGKPLLPAGFADRPKRGFALPFDAWLRGSLKPVLLDLLSPSAVEKRGFFSSHETEAVAAAFLENRLHWTRPWLLLMTELWAREVLDG